MDTIPEILAHAVQQFGDRLALRQHGGPDAPAYTFRQVGRLAEVLAARLGKHGVRKAQPVALLGENRPEWGIAYFAIHLAGAICVPVDARLKGREVRAILQRSLTPLLLVSRAQRPTAEEATAGMQTIETLTLEDLVADAQRPDRPQPGAPPADVVTGDDLAVLSFTSGTTGGSKAIMLTHRNIVSNVVAGVQWMGVSADDRLVSILPLNHLFEQTAGLLIPFLSGASVTYPGSLSPRTLLDAIQTSRTTIVLLVPAVARLFRKRILSAVRAQPAWKQRLFRGSLRLARAGQRAGLPLGKLLFRRVHRVFGGELKFFISGGAALDPELARFFLDLGMPILEGYGLSEAAPIVSCNTLRERADGAVGRPLPGVEVRIRPLAGHDENMGEVLVRGPNVMAGYFEDPDATAEAVQDGWLCTGDLGRLSADGYLYIVGRFKDVIVGEAGKNVYPEEIEAEIRLCPDVRDVCVLGIPASEGASRNEEVAVLVVPDTESLGGEYTPEHEPQLRTQVREACSHLADYKRPRYFAVWDGEFPRTTTLKIRKHEIRQQLAGVSLKVL